MQYVDTAGKEQDHRLQAWLEPRLAKAEVFALRTSFLSVPGVQEVAGQLGELLGRGGRVEMVLGGHDLQAEPQALWELLELLDGAAQAQVRVVTDPEVFHNAKTYYVRYPDQRAEAWVGSANLTRGGLMTNHEAGVLLGSDQEPEAVAAVLAGIEHYRQHPSAVPLTAEVIRPLEARQARNTGGRPRPALEGTRALDELLQPTMDEIDALASRESPVVAGIPTGFEDLDALTNGLAPGTLTVVASRPGVGRSTLLLDFLRSAAIKHHHPAALFSTEQTQNQLVQKLLSAEARLRLGDIRGGRMTDEDWTRLARRMTEICDAPLFFNATPAPHLEDLAAEITAVCAEYPGALVGIDSLSALTVPVEAGAGRERELAVAIRRLKALARELHIPLVATAELNRSTEHRNDKRPQLGDLRDSDVIAQVADKVLLLHRPDAYERDDPRMGEADLILAKHRAGPPSTITVAHQLHYSRFVDMAQE